MALVQLNANATAAIYTVGTVTAQTRAAWGDPWQDVPYLQPLAATLAASPTMPRATLLWHYGNIKHEDQNAFIWESPLNLLNCYVRILLYDNYGQQTLWVGWVQDVEYQVFGTDSASDGFNSSISGNQIFTAYGLEHILDRCAIVGATTPVGIIQWCPPFNDRSPTGPNQLGNRSIAQNSAGVYQFSSDGAMWSALDALYYLLTYYGPGYDIGLSGQYSLLADITAIWHVEGLTLKQAIDKLVDRRRGLGWAVRTDDYDNIAIYIFSTFDELITVGDITLQPNAETFSVAWDNDILTDDPVIELSQANVYDTIIIQGERSKCAFTGSVSDGQFVKAWTDAQQTAYLAITTNPPTLDAAGADALRAGDNTRPVFQHIVINPAWDWTVADPTGVKNPVSPLFDTLGGYDATQPSVAWPTNRPLLRWLPIPRYVDGERIDYVDPACYLQTTDGRWVSGENASMQDSESVQLRVLDAQMGVELHARVPHVLGLGVFGTVDTPRTDTDIEPAYDYTTAQITVAVETDARPTVKVQLNQTADFARTLVIDVPNVEFWYIAPATLAGYDANQNPIYYPPGTTRDDTAYLQQIAALVKSWYGVERAAIRWGYRQYITGLLPGMLCTQASSAFSTQNVGSVITSITHDFQTLKSTVQTGFGELDFATLLNLPNV